MKEVVIRSATVLLGTLGYLGIGIALAGAG